MPDGKEVLFYGGSTHNEADILMLHRAMKNKKKTVSFPRSVLDKNLAIETP